MTDKTHIIQNVLRANAYKLLAELFKYPDKRFNEIREKFNETFSELDPELGNIAKRLTECISPEELNMQESQVEYARLFIGPQHLEAPPYGSVYLDELGLVMGESTRDVIEYYLKAGLDPSDENKEPPDHISTELEFMYFLLYNAAAKDDMTMSKLGDSFVTNHLSRWIPSFADKIIAATDHRLYSELGLLLKKFIDLEVKPD